jgi:hypothetical protein
MTLFVNERRVKSEISPATPGPPHFGSYYRPQFDTSM